jgi:hypothetical protein
MDAVTVNATIERRPELSGFLPTRLLTRRA